MEQEKNVTTEKSGTIKRTLVNNKKEKNLLKDFHKKLGVTTDSTVAKMQAYEVEQSNYKECYDDNGNFIGLQIFIYCSKKSNGSGYNTDDIVQLQSVTDAKCYKMTRLFNIDDINEGKSHVKHIDLYKAQLQENELNYSEYMEFKKLYHEWNDSIITVDKKSKGKTNKEDLQGIIKQCFDELVKLAEENGMSKLECLKTFYPAYTTCTKAVELEQVHNTNIELLKDL